MPLTVSCFSKIQIGFTFLVPAHPGSPGQRAVKRVCVCVCLFILQENDASPGVVSTCADNLHKVKGLWNPAYLVLNFWPSAKAFQDVCASGINRL